MTGKQGSDETAAGVSGSDVQPATEPRAREGWQRPPFEPGNALAVKHGAYSHELVSKTADEIWSGMEAQLRQMPGYLEADQILVDEIREVVAQLVQLRVYRREVGILDAQGNPRSFVWLEDKLGRRLVDLGKALGLGASERAKVFGAFMAAGRAQSEAMAAQQRLRDKHQARQRKKRK